MKMRYIRLVMMAALSLLTMQSFAQSSLSVLRKMLSSSTVSIECDYTTRISNADITGRSQLLVQGNMYTMKGNGLAVYCNGTTLWTVDESSREVVIESCGSQEKDYMSNPVLLLSDLDRLFKVSSSRSLGSGKEEYILDAVVSCGVLQADLILSSDGRILSGKFLLEDDTTLSVKVSSMKKTEEKQVSFFSPQHKFGSDWIVTDLR